MIFVMAILIVQYFQFEWYPNTSNLNELEYYLAIKNGSRLLAADSRLKELFKAECYTLWIWPEKIWYHTKQKQMIAGL